MGRVIQEYNKMAEERRAMNSEEEIPTPNTDEASFGTEEEEVSFARPCEHPECSNWIEDLEWKYGWCEECQNRPEPDGYYEESDRQFEVNRGN